ncbi:MAG: hypothetical protein N4A63_08830 [Vallitalea sp.]|jgi:hypothetical protein|nr:hypothetical protein [Vallitalea sp.]
MKKLIAVLVCFVLISSTISVNAKDPICPHSPDGKHHMYATEWSTIEVGTSTDLHVNELIWRNAGVYKCIYCGEKVVVQGEFPNHWAGYYGYLTDALYYLQYEQFARVIFKHKSDLHYVDGPFQSGFLFFHDY